MRCYWKAKRSASTHPILDELRSSYLAEDLLQWEEARGGLDVQLGAQECSRLRALMGKLRVAPSAERKAEGLHAIVNRDIKRCPNNSAPLVSLSNMFRQLSAHVSTTAADIVNFARLLQQVRHGRDAVVQLGLGDHPHSAEKETGRS